MAMLMEAFPGRLISELYAEDQRLPVGVLDDVLEAQAYLTAKRMVDQAKDAKDLPDSPLIDLAKQITQELVQTEIDAEHADG